MGEASSSKTWPHLYQAKRYHITDYGNICTHRWAGQMARTGEGEVHSSFWSGYLQGRDHLET